MYPPFIFNGGMKELVMRKLIFLACLTFLLVACNTSTTEVWCFLGFCDDTSNQPINYDDPADVSRHWFSAYFDADVDKVVNLTCTMQADAIRQNVETLSGVAGAAEYDLSGVTFTVTEQTDVTAIVTTSGNIRVTAAGQTVEQDLGGAGIYPTMNLVFEDNVWKVCP